MLPFHVFANQNPRRSSSLAPAALRPRRFRHNEEKLVTRHDSRPVLSCVYALFHFPYPVTLAFATLKKTAGGVPTIPILELNTLRSTQSILVLSFHALTNCPFSIPFVLTFMHRMGGVGGTPNIQIFKPANISTLPLSSSHAGRIANTIRSRRRDDAKKSSNCFHGQYFLFSSFIPCSASAPVTISARASTN